MSAKPEDVQQKLQQAVALNKQLESQVARATAREKTATEAAQAVSARLKAEQGALESANNLLAERVKTELKLRDLVEKQSNLLDALSAEKETIDRQNADLKKKLEDTDGTFKDISGKLKNWDEEQKKLIQENDKLRSALSKINDYTKALEEKTSTEVKAKDLELQVSRSGVRARPQRARHTKAVA